MSICEYMKHKVMIETSVKSHVNEKNRRKSESDRVNGLLQLSFRLHVPLAIASRRISALALLHPGLQPWHQRLPEADIHPIRGKNLVVPFHPDITELGETENVSQKISGKAGKVLNDATYVSNQLRRAYYIPEIFRLRKIETVTVRT